jgi:hypothetical protein
MTEQQEVERAVYRTRWGYVPCDYETYQKIKRLRYLFLQGLIADAKWHRYNCKQPQNRVLRIPIRNAEGQKIGYEVKKIVRPPDGWNCSSNFHIERLYRAAKYPQPTPEDVPAVNFDIEQLDKELAKAEDWYSQKKWEYVLSD